MMFGAVDGVWLGTAAMSGATNKKLLMTFL
jgi:hypothetical protein